MDRTNRTVKLVDVIRAIKNEVLTDMMLRSSVHFASISDRYTSFSYNSLTTLSYTDAIINFNPILAHSRISSDYLLFEKKGNGYNHLGIAYNNISHSRYIETFFYEPSAQYINGQTIEQITKFTITDSNNIIIVSDTF